MSPRDYQGGWRGLREPNGKADAAPGSDRAGGRGGGERVKLKMYFEGRTNRMCSLDGEGGVVREKNQK